MHNNLEFVHNQRALRNLTCALLVYAASDIDVVNQQNLKFSTDQGEDHANLPNAQPEVTIPLALQFFDI